MNKVGGAFLYPCTHFHAFRMDDSHHVRYHSSMANSFVHAQASARHFKAGKPEDFIDIHEWIDQFKQSNADVRHRAFLHNSQGPWMAQQVFGHVREVEKWPLGSGKMIQIPVREIAESHIIEDLGWIPSPADWASCMECKVWMGGKRNKFIGREELLDADGPITNLTRTGADTVAGSRGKANA